MILKFLGTGSAFSDKRVYFSGGKLNEHNIIKYYNKLSNSDIIFHEVEFADYEGSIHTQYRDLILCMNSHIKSKTYLYHYNIPDDKFDEINRSVKEDGFAGLVRDGDEFKI